MLTCSITFFSLPTFTPFSCISMHLVACNMLYNNHTNIVTFHPSINVQGSGWFLAINYLETFQDHFLAILMTCWFICYSFDVLFNSLAMYFSTNTPNEITCPKPCYMLFHQRIPSFHELFQKHCIEGTWNRCNIHQLHDSGFSDHHFMVDAKCKLIIGHRFVILLHEHILQIYNLQLHT